MRIAFIYDAVYPYVIGGAEKRIHALAKSLRARHAVSIYGFAYWERNPEGRLVGCRYVDAGQPVPFYTKTGKRSLWEALVFALGLVGPLLRSDDRLWEVSHVPFLSVIVAALIASLKGAKLVVVWHEYYGASWGSYFNRGGSLLARAIERLALLVSPVIVTSSRSVKQRLIEAGVSAPRISIIPNGIEVDRIAEILRVPDSSDLIYVGRLVEHKQVRILIQALRIIHDASVPARLWIIGDGPERESLQELAGDLELQGHIAFLGFFPSDAEVYARLKACRVLVNPSRREGFGITILEGWACGLPAVVCDEPTSALPELIDEPFKGRVVPSGATEIAGACLELFRAETPAARERRVAAAGKYDVGRMARDMEALYESVGSA